MKQEQADKLRVEYARRYGSTTRGLVLHHGVDPVELLHFVHDVPVESYLSPDEDLRCLLDCIQARKCLFTNGPSDYARRVLIALGVPGLFHQIFDIAFSGYRGKPHASVYVQVGTALGVSGAGLMLMDDSPANLVPARALGWQTVWLQHANGQGQDKVEGWADFVVGDLWEVGRVFRKVGVLDEAHHILWDRCLGSCRLGEARSPRPTRPTSCSREPLDI